MKFPRAFVPLLLLCLSPFVASRAGAADAGAHASFLFEQAGHQVKVWHHRPAGLAADAPVLFVIHGVGRNGEEYLADWIDLANEHRFLLVVPEFSKKQFPGEESFNSGNLFNASGAPTPREQWSFSMIEPIFDAVRAQLGSTRTDYLIYGHSAGAQFVQRLLYLVPEARIARAVAANAGWYMLPDLGVNFPYGVRGTAVDAAALRRAFARRLVVLLGEADTDAKHPALRHTPEADAQGLHRFARGQFFFARARALAADLNTPFHWTLATAPGIAHSNKGMAPFAIPHLFP
jgi:poly(3-hydroxybutyrate) depolymerase